jgi:ABC-type multidrug transport system ATPase subunit
VWSTLWTTPPANSAGSVGVPLGAAMLLLFVNAAGLMAAALWIDSRRFRSKDAKALAAAAKDVKQAAAAAAAGGGESTKPPNALVAAGLRREYESGGLRGTTVALHGLDLVCPAGEITVLLGHNGAGKSSAIGCLVGAAPPTRGRATIGGLDAVSPEARRLLGFCPQHDTLWDDLTVQDHLDMTLRLRGVWDAKEAERQREALLREVELRAKRRVRAGALSGGMRRRLSVALAFAGNPAHVILDEPTAGVDPRARRQIQNLLLAKAKGRAVLVTTHHLDEAERLGSRVAVLHRGRLACAGTPRELKEKYDVGYRLVITLSVDSTKERIERDAAAEAIVAVLREKVPAAKREGVEGRGEVSIAVPGSCAAALPAALRALRDASGMLGVAGFGLAAPSLDGVFHAVEKENDDEAMVTTKTVVTAPPAAPESGWVPGDATSVVIPGKGSKGNAATGGGGGGWFQAAAAVTSARLRATWRDPVRLVMTLAAPTLLLCAAAAIAGFPTFDPAYARESHTAFDSTSSAASFVPVFACHAGASEVGAGASGASVHAPWAKLDATMAAAGAAVEWLPEAADPPHPYPLRPSGTCYSEAAVWDYQRGVYPDGLRPRAAAAAPLSGIALALGAGSGAAGAGAGAGTNATAAAAAAATVWWGTIRPARAAMALLARVKIDATANASAATAAAGAGLVSGKHRRWAKSDKELRRATLAAGPGPATAAAAALLAASVPPCLAAAAAARERATGLRRVLLVAGMPRSAHWTGTVAADAALLLPAVALGAVALAAGGMDTLGGAGVATAAGLLLVHALAALAVAHLVALAFCDDAASALPTCLLAGALPASLLVGMTYTFDALGMPTVVAAVAGAGTLFPGYAVAQGLIELSLEHAMGSRYTGGGGNGVGAMMAAAAGVGAAATLGVAIVDASAGLRAVFEHCASSEVEARKLQEADGERDADVVAEEERVRGEVTDQHDGGGISTNDDKTPTPMTTTSTSAVRLVGLNKKYLGQSRPAVRDLWLGVAPGECFGLLGINGCGKTTTFRMAAGDLPPTRGRVSIAVAGGHASAGGVGYCPQRDSLSPALTVSEHLHLTAAARRGRGRPATSTSTASASASAAVAAVVAAAGLKRFADVRAGHLSGGNKRKLCLAMALMGLREGGLALLDEPTAGVDPGARDAITETVRAAAVERKCAVVVTSHSIEDASALCQRVGVMVDGALLCLGPPQHLRTKHGKHLTLTVHPRAPTAAAAAAAAEVVSGMGEEAAATSTLLDAFVKATIPGAVRVIDSSTGGGGGSTFSAHTDEEAAAVAAAAASAAAAAAETTASLTWELPAATAARLPEILEVGLYKFNAVDP